MAFDHDRIICPQCEDRLIHQNRRREHEAASGLLQWIHDNVRRGMDIVDDDEDPFRFDIVRQKLKPPLWRRCEHKPVAGSFGDSQQFLLPRIAATIEHGINMKLHYPTSGVFGIWSDPPHDKGVVRKVRPYLPLAFGPEHRLTGAEWERFWLCEDQDRWR